NLELLKIVLDEGLAVDAMSPGEIYVEEAAGFPPERIMFVSNNVSAEEMAYAVDRGIMVSVDSLSQLDLYGRSFPNTRVTVRFNPGVGAGHHAKVVTGGKKTKFGIQVDHADDVIGIAKKYSLTVAGINQHIGSLFMEGEKYVEGASSLMAVAKRFPDLEFIDLGGGFGIPYRKVDGERRLDLADLGMRLERVIADFTAEYGREIMFKIEPGRYIAAECGLILGTVQAVKDNYGMRYIGTDIGFNVLKRPVMYDSFHEIEIYADREPSEERIKQRLVGNICETGDILANDRLLPEIRENDVIGVIDAGAYGFSMSSNYNMRLKPAEVLITQDGMARLIRRRDRLEDLLTNFYQ
ncbi:MAG: diaminopimelate decarboxylase, partial [Spirochaetota bacterium]